MNGTSRLITRRGLVIRDSGASELNTGTSESSLTVFPAYHSGVRDQSRSPRWIEAPALLKAAKRISGRKPIWQFGGVAPPYLAEIRHWPDRTQSLDLCIGPRIPAFMRRAAACYISSAMTSSVGPTTALRFVGRRTMVKSGIGWRPPMGFLSGEPD